MGTDFASSVTDIFPFSYKFDFMKLLISTDFSIAAIPANIYIDDLFTLNSYYFAYTRSPPPQPPPQLRKPQRVKTAGS